jgi:MinD superfamily P-loop ATPase
MKRNIIKIDQDKCVGCGLCASACHQGAIGIVDGKAKLLSEDYCDGLGKCLPACPVGAISLEEREAAKYDSTAKNKVENKTEKQAPLACGCPGNHAKTLARPTPTRNESASAPIPTTQLNQWPVQIKLVPANAPYLNDAHLLVAADCSAYAYGNFHNDFMRNKITVIGCPKLDEGNYSEKLIEILKGNNIKSVTVVRMEVPCCGGLENAVKTALKNCDKMIPWQVVTISTDGEVLEN